MKVGFFLICLFLLQIVFAQDFDLLIHETFESGAENWQPNNPDHWRIVKQDGQSIYELMKPGDNGPIRKPTSISILKPYTVGSFELEVEAKCYTKPSNKYRDLCLFFGYQDSVHFYYVHFSGVSDKVHNAIHIVNNADREKINVEPPGQSPALLADTSWYTLKVKRDIETGSIEAFVDGQKVLSAVDTTFTWGNIGLGSFDDTGAFREVKLWGEIVETKVGQFDHMPYEYWLGQNYPNPFNPQTRIDYTLIRPEHVDLHIYDLNGHLICSLVGQQQPAGRHSVTFQAGDLASGIYVCRLSTQSFQAMRCMTFVQ